MTRASSCSQGGDECASAEDVHHLVHPLENRPSAPGGQGERGVYTGPGEGRGRESGGEECRAETGHR